jgi:hypothetical protein
VGTKSRISILLGMALIAVLAGCGGGGSTAILRNAPLPVSSSVSIALQPTPPGTVFLNATASFTAVVSNDSSNLGVDWSLTCQNSGNCGSLSPLHTDSGKPTTYTPPSTISGNNQIVTILAFATADHSQNVVTPITVTGFAGSLKGTFVLQTSGVDAFGPYRFAGVAVLDGNGDITSGEQTYSNPSVLASDSITGGSYFIGADGRGTIKINTANQSLGQQGIETFSLVLLSSSQALIARIDDPSIPGTSTESSSGTMDLQTSAVPPAGGYAFVVRGTDINSAPMAFGGVLNIDSPKAISGSGSVADQDLAGTVTNCLALSGTVTDVDSFGSVKFNLTADCASVPIEFTGYILDSAHIKLIESDNATGSGFGLTDGLAIGQGSATGTFSTGKSFSGAYVFGIFGNDLSGLPSSLASAGTVTADAIGNLQGFNDEFQSGLAITISERFTGTYAIDPAGTGRVDSSINYLNSGAGPELIFYLTGNGNPPLILDADSNALGGSAVGTGIAYRASRQVSFSGEYGVSFTENSGGTENDVIGQMTVDSTAQTLSGIVDTNFGFNPVPDTALNGSFHSTANLHRFTGTLSNQLFPAALCVAYYIVDPGHGFFVEADSVQLSFGYFAARSPVCQGCP